LAHQRPRPGDWAVLTQSGHRSATSVAPVMEGASEHSRSTPRRSLRASKEGLGNRERGGARTYLVA
jgi:hypothetical protein